MDGIIYKPTRAMRATLTQEITIFLPPEPAAPGCYRVVQVMVPESPKVSIDFDQNPEALGVNREYKIPTWPPNAQIRFDLLPGQWLVGASNVGYAEVSLIIEHRYSAALERLQRGAQ